MKAAAQSNLSHARFLTHVIEEEYRIKCEAALQQRLKLAKIPEKWVMDTFPFERQPKLNKKKILALYDSMAFLRDKQNIIWLGGTGCGKTGLATSFLIQAIQQGARGGYVLFTDLLNELHRSQADRSQNQVIRRYVKYDLLLIDEIGYAEAEPSQVGLFFTLLQKRRDSLRASSGLSLTGPAGFAVSQTAFFPIRGRVMPARGPSGLRAKERPFTICRNTRSNCRMSSSVEWVSKQAGGLVRLRHRGAPHASGVAP